MANYITNTINTTSFEITNYLRLEGTPGAGSLAWSEAKLKKGETAIWYDRIQREIPRWFMTYWGEVTLPPDPNGCRVERSNNGCMYKYKTTNKKGELVEIHLEFKWEEGNISAFGRIYYLDELDELGYPLEFLEYLIPILD